MANIQFLRRNRNATIAIVALIALIIIGRLLSSPLHLSTSSDDLSIVSSSEDSRRGTMTHPDGGFYSAEDAESAPDPAKPEEKEEGAFYTWKKSEIDRILTPVEAEDVQGAQPARPWVEQAKVQYCVAVDRENLLGALYHFKVVPIGIVIGENGRIVREVSPIDINDGSTREDLVVPFSNSYSVMRRV